MLAGEPARGVPYIVCGRLRIGKSSVIGALSFDCRVGEAVGRDDGRGKSVAPVVALTPVEGLSMRENLLVTASTSSFSLPSRENDVVGPAIFRIGRTEVEL